MAFTAMQLAQLKAHAEGFMTSQGNVLVQGSSTNAAGYKSAGAAWTASNQSPMKCRLVEKPRIAVETPQGGQMTSLKRFQIYVPLGTVVDPKNRFQMVGGLTYNIIATDAGRTDAAQIELEVELAQ